MMFHCPSKATLRRSVAHMTNTRLAKTLLKKLDAKRHAMQQKEPHDATD